MFPVLDVAAQEEEAEAAEGEDAEGDPDAEAGFGARGEGGMGLGGFGWGGGGGGGGGGGWGRGGGGWREGVLGRRGRGGGGEAGGGEDDGVEGRLVHGALLGDDGGADDGFVVRVFVVVEGGGHAAGPAGRVEGVAVDRHAGFFGSQRRFRARFCFFGRFGGRGAYLRLVEGFEPGGYGRGDGERVLAEVDAGWVSE